MQKNQRKSQLDSLERDFGCAPEPEEKRRIKELLKDPAMHGRKADLPIEWIETGDNQRESLGDISPLIEQIREVGLIQPVGVQLLDDKITIVYGHRRLEAFKALALKDQRFSEIPCMFQIYQEKDKRVVAQAVENLGRSDLDPIDQCEAIARLKESVASTSKSRVSNEHLGDFLGGIHRKTIETSLIIASWSSENKALARKKNLSITQLRTMAKKAYSQDRLLEILKGSKEENTRSNRIPVLTTKQKEVVSKLNQLSIDCRVKQTKKNTTIEIELTDKVIALVDSFSGTELNA